MGVTGGGNLGRERGGGVGYYGLDMLKPNLSGCSAKSLARIVDLPAPEGPLMTIGRGEGVEAILLVAVVEMVRARRRAGRRSMD